MTCWPPEWNEVFSRLDNVTGSATHWESHCPCHDDRKKSLSIRVGRNGALVIKCMAPCACATGAILKRIGLGFQNLYLNPKGDNMAPPAKTTTKKEDAKTPATPSATTTAKAPTRKLAATYDYRDEKGVLLYQVVRFANEGGGKSFNQRRPNPDFDKNQPVSKEKNPEWIYNLDGVTRVLYRIGELTKALKEKPTRQVMIMEGEKDVDLAREKGITATCNPMGALKWSPEYNEVFRDVHVRVIADNDPVDPTLGFSPGIHHAETICEQLAPIAASVYLVVLPDVGPKGDFSDWWPKQKGTDDERRKALNEVFKKSKLYPPPEEDGGISQDGDQGAGQDDGEEGATDAPGAEADTNPGDDADSGEAIDTSDPAINAEAAAFEAGMEEAKKAHYDAGGCLAPANGSMMFHGIVEYLSGDATKLRSVAEMYGILALQFADVRYEFEKVSPELAARGNNMPGNERMKKKLIALASALVKVYDQL